MERKRPQFGIGFGQRGYWGNRHFSTEQMARQAYTNYVNQVRESYRKPFGSSFVVELIPVAGSVIEAFRLVNLKKNGQRGKIVHTVHLYQIDEKQADMFMKDPFYAVEA